MDGSNALWLVLGLGFGSLSVWWRSTTQTPPLRSAAPSHETEPLNQPSPAQQTDPSDSQCSQQLDEARLAYQAALELSQFQGGFLARTSHELRSPLNGMIGMHQLILSDLCDSPEEEREFIAQAHTSALKMVKVLDTILDVAKLSYSNSQLQLQPTQLAKTLQQVQQLTHLQAHNRNLRLHIAIPDEALYVWADPNRLRHALVILVDTAISQMQEGQISLTVHPDDPTQTVQLLLEDDRPPEAWSEATNGLSTVTPASNLTQPLTAMADLSFPSPSLKLWLSQTLLQTMGSPLELLTTSAQPGSASTPHRNRLRCILPCVPLEADLTDE